MVAPPIDYNALRVALVAAAMAACGLDQNGVIMAEPEVPNAPRPALPYLALKLTVANVAYGWDQADWVTGTQYTMSGVRSATLSTHSFGRSHEEAYGLLATWQANLQAEPTLDLLRQSGIAVWNTSDVRDLSLLLNTGYEGRAQMDVTLGLASVLTLDLGAIRSLAVQGTITPDGGAPQNVSVQLHSS